MSRVAVAVMALNRDQKETNWSVSRPLSRLFDKFTAGLAYSAA